MANGRRIDQDSEEGRRIAAELGAAWSQDPKTRDAVELVRSELTTDRRQMPRLAKAAGLTRKAAKAALDDLVRMGEALHEYAAHNHYYRSNPAATAPAWLPPGSVAVVPRDSVFVVRLPEDIRPDAEERLVEAWALSGLDFVILEHPVRVHRGALLDVLQAQG